MCNLDVVIGIYFVGAAMASYMTWVSMWYFLDIANLQKKSKNLELIELQQAMNNYLQTTGNMPCLRLFPDMSGSIGYGGYPSQELSFLRYNPKRLIGWLENPNRKYDD